MIIAVDFDGVIVPTGCWPGIGEANLPLIKKLKELRESGNKLILWTNRVNEALDLAVSFCGEYGLEFDAINDNLPEITEHFGSNSRKVYADIFLDDRAVCVKHKKGVELIDERIAE